VTGRLVAIAAVGCLLLAAAPARADQARRLSDERTYSRSAEVRRAAPIRVAPRGTARAIGRLRHWTEDRFPEIYLLLRQRESEAGTLWVQVRIPGRPNGRKGWVPAGALGYRRFTRWSLVVDRGMERALLKHRGKTVWTAPVGVGAPGMATPVGRFWIREKLRVPFGGGTYGPWAFGTAAYSALSEWPGGGVVGVHGTDQPSLVPGRPSHGCIRMRNADIRHLARMLPIGASLLVR
jgi:hypothetical protein